MDFSSSSSNLSLFCSETDPPIKIEIKELNRNIIGAAKNVVQNILDTDQKYITVNKKDPLISLLKKIAANVC